LSAGKSKFKIPPLGVRRRRTPASISLPIVFSSVWCRVWKPPIQSRRMNIVFRPTQVGRTCYFVTQNVLVCYHFWTGPPPPPQKLGERTRCPCDSTPPVRIFPQQNSRKFVERHQIFFPWKTFSSPLCFLWTLEMIVESGTFTCPSDGTVNFATISDYLPVPFSPLSFSRFPMTLRFFVIN